jgi:hypothetical protein
VGRGARASAPRYASSVIDAKANVSADTLASIEVIVAGQKTLEDVVRWGLAQRPARLVERVVVQDEYTHDVVIAWADGIYLVYDTT